MTEHDRMLRILEFCLDLEQQALQLYRDFAEQAEDPGWRELWLAMAGDEDEHLQYWHRLLEMHREGIVPEIFDDPGVLEDYFGELRPKIRRLTAEACETGDPETRLLIALRLEFYLLDPQFQALFHCLYNLPGGESPEADYARHLDRLMEALRGFAGGSPALALLDDAFQRLWQINRQAIRLSMKDHLTGLYNRRGLFAAIKPLVYLARRNCQPVGVMMVDIDNFKAINDTLGHPRGDRVLAEVAQRMRARLRGSDIIGRYGGEEFLVVMTPFDPGHLAQIAEELRRCVAAPAIVDMDVSISIGLAQMVMEKDVEKGMEMLLHRADQALLEAKKRGKNRVVAWEGTARKPWAGEGGESPGPASGQSEFP